MLYKFKSKAAGDLLMLGPQGDQLMRLLGREPAGQGIIEVADMPQAMALLEAAIAAEPQPEAAGDEARDETGKPVVSLRQRLWPMIEMLRRCHAAGAPVVWGV